MGTNVITTHAQLEDKHMVQGLYSLQHKKNPVAYCLKNRLNTSRPVSIQCTADAKTIDITPKLGNL